MKTERIINFFKLEINALEAFVEISNEFLKALESSKFEKTDYFLTRRAGYIEILEKIDEKLKPYKDDIDKNSNLIKKFELQKREKLIKIKENDEKIAKFIENKKIEIEKKIIQNVKIKQTVSQFKANNENYKTGGFDQTL